MGSSTRQSDTLGEMTIYRAIKLDDGTVLRVSGTQKNVLGMVLQLIPGVSGADCRDCAYLGAGLAAGDQAHRRPR